MKTYREILTEARRKDSKGKPIFGRDEFVLWHKSRKRYVGTKGSIGAGTSSLEKDEGSAKVWTGHQLNDMDFDWTMTYDAIKVDV
jgi:hypothetical protein